MSPCGCTSRNVGCSPSHGIHVYFQHGIDSIFRFVFFFQGITVLLSLTVFMLLVAEIMPATSDSVPLIGTSLFVFLLGTKGAPGTERIRCHRRRVSGSSSGRFGGGYFGWAFPKEFNVILFSPLPGQYFASIMIIVGMSVIATVVVLQYHHHDPNGGNMPKWVRLLPHSHTALLSSPF